MSVARREFLRLAVAAPAFSFLPQAVLLPEVAMADTYPSRPVRLIVGYPPGGVTDIVARLIAPWLSEHLGQPFVVENRPGASSNIALQEVVNAAPDGHTLFLVSASNTYNVALYDNLKFDLLKDQVFPASIGRDAFVIVVNPAFPVKTGAEFIAYAKANPGKITMATSGLGSSSDLYGALFKSLAKVDLLTVHYRGVGPAIPDLMSGRVEVMFLPVVSALGYIKAGTLRGLGVTTATRRAVVPDVPSIGDFVPGYEATDWTGISAPLKTPPDVIATLNKQVNAALADAGFRKQLADLGVDPFPTTPDDFARYIADYTGKWGKIIHAAGIKAE